MKQFLCFIVPLGHRASEEGPSVGRLSDARGAAMRDSLWSYESAYESRIKEIKQTRSKSCGDWFSSRELEPARRRDVRIRLFESRFEET